MSRETLNKVANSLKDHMEQGGIDVSRAGDFAVFTGVLSDASIALLDTKNVRMTRDEDGSYHFSIFMDRRFQLPEPYPQGPAHKGFEMHLRPGYGMGYDVVGVFWDVRKDDIQTAFTSIPKHVEYLDSVFAWFAQDDLKPMPKVA